MDLVFYYKLHLLIVILPGQLSSEIVLKKHHNLSIVPLSIDPALAKRRLFQIPIERIEDPTLAQLFREQQLELDRKFTMLIDRDSPRFLYGSLQLFGAVEDSLLKLAKELLEQLSPRSRDESKANALDAKAFAARAKQELDYFRKTLPDIGSKIIVQEDITGLMVSKGNLLIGARTKIPAARVDALIAHEVGTHVLTYLNGKSQRLQQLYIGFPGYDELQEGLAVLIRIYGWWINRNPYAPVSGPGCCRSSIGEWGKLYRGFP